MFRNICLLFVLFFATNSAWAQGFKFGVFFDPTITWLRSDVSDVTLDRACIGFDLGLSADYYFARNYAFATGMSLFNTGGTLRYANGIDNFRIAKADNVQIPENGKVKYKLQYIKIPVGMKFKTHRIGRYVYSANTGFDPMIRVTARAAINGGDNVKVNEEIKLLNVGWHIGADAQYSLGQDVSLFFGLTYMNVFTDMTTPARDMITSNNLLFRIGIMF